MTNIFLFPTKTIGTKWSRAVADSPPKTTLAFCVPSASDGLTRLLPFSKGSVFDGPIQRCLKQLLQPGSVTPLHDMYLYLS